MAKETADPMKKGPTTKKVEVMAEPILSGRLLLAFLMLGLMVGLPLSGVGQLFTKRAPETTDAKTWQIGDSARVNLTVMAADYDRLACASDQVFQGARCAFDAATEAVSTIAPEVVDDNHRNQLQPYRSTDGQLLLIPAVWAQPSVATRVHQEPYEGVKDKRLSRFVISCELQFMEKWQKVQVRWKQKEKWSDQGEAMIAKPIQCSVLRSQG